MKTKILMILSFTTVVNFCALAQIDSARIDSLINTSVYRWDSSGLVYFNPNTVYPGDLITLYADLIYTDEVNTGVLIDQSTDSILGRTHYKYQQYFNGIPVEAAELIEHKHQSENYLVYAHGKVCQFTEEDTFTYQMNEQSAWNILSENYFADSFFFAWEDSAYEQEIKNDLRDSTATYYPVGQGKFLMALDNYKDLGYNIDKNKYRPAWRFDVLCLEPDFHKAYYVDAITGGLIREDALNIKGTATIWYHSPPDRFIDTRWRGGIHSDYILNANDNSRNFETKYYKGKNWGWISHIDHNTDTWGTDEHGATATHWNTQMSWDYYKNVHKRTGMDDEGGELRVFADGGFDYAEYDEIKGIDYIKFGHVNDGWHGRGIDIVGHEFTHGVNQNSISKLNSTFEPGALGESFGCIFGCLIEFYAEGGINDWIFGEDPGDIPTASLANPKTDFFHYTDANCNSSATGQPDTYKGQYWFNGSCESGGSHGNAGVMNFWFYLLVNGGTGYNDNNDYYDVAGINISQAEKIAYLTMTNGLISGSQFADARSETIAQTIGLYGQCSRQHRQVELAWYAVGVGPYTICPPATGITSNLPHDHRPPIVHPNPTESQLFIEFGTFNNKTLLLYDMRGSLIKSWITDDNRESIGLDELNPGIYILTIQEKDSRYHFKVVKY